jgi:predicted dehydrogenase
LEYYAVARLYFDGGATASLACSWNLPAGQDAVIRAFFYGTKGGLAVENVGGSFYDFRAAQFSGTVQTILDEPPDAWGGRAVVDWARRLAASPRYDAAIECAHEVARVIDEIYAAEKHHG